MTNESNNKNKENGIYGGKYYYAYTPTRSELEKAKTLNIAECPRRYCWFWRSLKFEYDISVVEGCNVANEFPFDMEPREPVICCRASGDSLDFDIHEPREPYLEKDGFKAHHFSNAKAGLTRVYLNISEFSDDPSIITTIIGLEPTKPWKRGEPSAPNSNFSLVQSGWKLYSPLALSASAEEHLEALLSVLEARAQGVKKITNRFSASLEIHGYDEWVDFQLSNGTISRLANLGIALNFIAGFAGYDDEE